MADNTLKIVIGVVDEASEKLVQVGDKVKATGEKISNAGSKLTASLTAPIALVGGAAVKAFADFEQSMSNVSTLIDESVEDMDAMGAAVLDISKRVPVAAMDLSSSLYDIRSAGISAADSMSTLEDAAMLGVAGLGSTKEATNLLTTAINAFGLQGRDSNEVADVLFKTVKAGKTDISQLSGAFGKMAGNAKAANIAFEDVQAATAAITALTGKTSEAQNALAQVFLELTQTGGKLDKALQENGKSLEWLNTAIGDEGLVQGMKSAQKMMNLTETEFKNMFSSAEGGTAIYQLLTDAYDMNNAALEDMMHGSNKMQEAFEKQTETAKSQWQFFKNGLNVVLIELGSIILPHLVSAMDWLGQKLSDLGDWLSGLDPFWQNFIVTAAMVIAAIGPVIFIIGTVISTIGTLGTVIGSLGQALVFLTGPIGLIIVAIGALVAAGLWLYKHWDEVRAFAVEVWGVISAWVAEKLNAISETIGTITAWISEKWISAWTAISDFFGGIWEAISRVAEVAFAIIIGIVVAFLDWLWPNWLDTMTKIYTWFGETWDKVRNKFSEWSAWFKEFYTKVLDGFKLKWEAIWSAIGGFFNFIWDSISKWFGEKWAVFTGLLDKGISAVQNSFAGFGAGVANLFSGIWDGIKNVFQSGINWVIDKINWLIEKYNKLPFAPQIDLIARLGEGGGGGGSKVTPEQALGVLRPDMQLASPASSNMSQSSFQVNVSGNNFYGDDSAFASKIGNTILSSVKESTNAIR